ncbi:MAG: hypothetical protein U0L98_04710 [Clostridia bacterium]|nr:hypothetical protein [Clostridia bacterium]
MNEIDDLTKLLKRTINKIETNRGIDERSSKNMRRTIHLVEGSTNGDEIYNKMKKEFLDKEYKKSVEDIEKRNNENIKELNKNHKEIIKSSKKSTEKEKNMAENSKKEYEKRYKEILKDAINVYGVGEEVIREIFKLAEKNDFVFPSEIERSLKVCKILNIRNTEDLKEKEEDFTFLVFNF